MVRIQKIIKRKNKKINLNLKQKIIWLIILTMLTQKDLKLMVFDMFYKK